MYLVVPPGGCFPETRRIELGPGPLTIGRAEGCDVQVDVPGVDQEHAKISEVALVAIGADCAVGDVPLDAGSRRLVMPGDEIQIGSVVLALEGDDPSIAPPPPDMAGARAQPASATLAAPRVRVVEGANFGDELVLSEEGREYLLGRGPKCDLILDDREVSREHVKLVRRAYVIHVQDLSSTRGSWLGRSAVYTGSTIEWTRPRMLRVGATVLSLELPEAIRRAAPGAQASAPMTPPPRSRGSLDGSATPSGPGVVSGRGNNNRTPAPSEPPPGSAVAAAVAAAAAQTRNLGVGSYDPTPPPRQVPASPGAPHVAPGAPGASGAAGASGPSAQGGAQVPRAASSGRALGPLPPHSQARTAWKKSGPTIGKVSGLLLLALAGLAILGALFVVFSLLE